MGATCSSASGGPATAKPRPLAIVDPDAKPTTSKRGKKCENGASKSGGVKSKLRLKSLRRNSDKVSALDDGFSQDICSATAASANAQKRARRNQEKNGAASPTTTDKPVAAPGQIGDFSPTSAAITSVPAAPGKKGAKGTRRPLPPMIDLKAYTSRLPIEHLPKDVNVCIASYFARGDVFQCALVCRAWKDALTQASLWEYIVATRTPHVLDVLRPIPPAAGPTWGVMLKAALLDPIANVMQNAIPTTLVQHNKSWRILGSGKITIEQRAVSGPEAAPNVSTLEMPQKAVSRANEFPVWAAKAKVHRRQVVNLDALGYPLHVLDREAPRAPTLRVSEGVLCKSAASSYRLRVKLMGAWRGATQEQEVLGEFDTGVVTGQGVGEWRLVEHIFASVKGVRYVSWESWFADAEVTAAGARFRV